MILYYTNYSSIIILAFIHNVTFSKALKSPNQLLALTGRLTNQVLFSTISFSWAIVGSARNNRINAIKRLHLERWALKIVFDIIIRFIKWPLISVLTTINKIENSV